MTRKLKRQPLTQVELAEKKVTAKLKVDERPGGDLSKLLSAPKKSQATGIAGKTSDPLHLIRHQGMIDFVTDPDCRSAQYHFERADRHYGRYVSWPTFSEWCTEDDWVARREQFWDQLSLKILDQEQERLLAEQKREIEQLQHVRSHLIEHLMPLMKASGEVMRYPKRDKHGEKHPLAGKPVLPYGFTSYDKAIRSMLEVDKQLMLKRGEVTTRSEAAAMPTEDGTAQPSTSPLDPATRTVQFTPDQLRAMSRSLLREAQPGLDQPLVIDAEVEADHDGDD
jgi:hypothetical protein